MAITRTRPHGWGAAEILRALREDSTRYRRSLSPEEGRESDCDDTAETVRYYPKRKA